ncbi:prolyl oligopeptidase family serine peptidase [Thermosynechococcus sp.]|uniref:S9 family peptidase n=1 Tax=Thermosynechococcus sp. TaxID=2814275 RepID=UPI00391C1AC0
MSPDYGWWPSILSAAAVSAAAPALSELRSTALGLVWLERRPQEKGRVVLVRQGQELLAAPLSVRSRVNEYGGGAYWYHGDQIYFVNDADQGIYALGKAIPRLIYRADNCRFADGCVDAGRDRLLCVEEVQLPEGGSQQSLVAISLAGERTALVTGAGFYAAPRLSPKGDTLVWLQWSAPQMPWDGCELWGATVKGEGTLGTPYRIAGSNAESVQQPQWQGESLYYISDRSGWWNLYRYRNGRHEPVWQAPYDAGVPLWVFGQSTYALVTPETAVLTYSDRGLWRLAVVSLRSGEWQPIPTDYSEIHSLVRVSDRAVAFIGSSPLLPPHIVQFDLEDGTTTPLHPIAAPLPPAWISQPEVLEFPTADGATAYGFFYPPHNPQVQPPPSSRPPLIVRCHGGPTAASGSGLDLRTQFWTTRGFAVLDVNYRGSSGYGRAYRNALRGQWGVVDVADCSAAAQYLVAQGRVAGNPLLIRGSSAGGYTALCALTFTTTFHGGASYYGIGDLISLLKETHAFEAHYFDQLIAPYPEGADLYRRRSPLYHVERLTRPVIFFQGLKDVVVPPTQAEQMVAALQARGVPVEYYTFAEEGHGFRQSSTIATALAAELQFYQRHLLKG